MRTVGIEAVPAAAAGREPLDLPVTHGRLRTTLPSYGALHFSSRGEYGVRLMVELARHYGAGPVSLSEMAVHEDLPRPYLEQLVVSLRGAGLVASTRGAHGGYELIRDPTRDPHERSHHRARRTHRADDLCQRGSGSTRESAGAPGFCNVNLLWVRVRDAVVTRSTRSAWPTSPGRGPRIPITPRCFRSFHSPRAQAPRRHLPTHPQKGSPPHDVS